MYRALITDLDGTAVKLSSDGTDVSVQTRHTVTLAQDKGSIIACATGRDWDIAKPVVDALGLTSPCIIAGGSAIIDPLTDKIVWERPLEKGASHKILAIFKDNATTGTAYLPGAGIPLAELETVPDEIRLFYLIAIPRAEARTIASKINGSGFAVAHLTPSWAGAHLLDVHVTHPEATKEHALGVWQQRQGVTKAETIGMGDSENDLPLFRGAGLRVASGNAIAEIKELADYIAPSAEDGALLHVIEKFLLK